MIIKITSASINYGTGQNAANKVVKNIKNIDLKNFDKEKDLFIGGRVFKDVKYRNEQNNIYSDNKATYLVGKNSDYVVWQNRSNNEIDKVVEYYKKPQTKEINGKKYDRIVAKTEYKNGSEMYENTLPRGKKLEITISSKGKVVDINDTSRRTPGSFFGAIIDSFRNP